MVKKLVVTILAVLLVFSANAKTKSSKLLSDELKVREDFQKREHDARLKDINKLQDAKVLIINGDIDGAEEILLTIHNLDSEVVDVKERYLALIYFIRGDYKKTIRKIEDSNFRTNNRYREVCFYELFSHLALQDYKNFKIKYDRCRPITINFSRNEQIWLTNIIDIAINKKYKIGTSRHSSNEYIMGNTENLILWLKMALYANREDYINYYIGSISSEAYRSKRVREILGLAYYRLGDKKRALEFVEDISSSNSENLKGNLNLEEDKLELAFGHFMLALKNKENSLNAIERAIPISWQLNMNKEGKEILSKHIGTNQINRSTLDIAFDIRLKNYELAKKKLLLLNTNFTDNTPFKVNLMNSFIATYLNDDVNKTIYSEKACTEFDGVNCYIRFLHTQYPNLAEVMKNKSERALDTSIDLEALKAQVKVTEMDEPQLVNQTDVEELDSKLVKIPLKSLEL